MCMVRVSGSCNKTQKGKGAPVQKSMAAGVTSAVHFHGANTVLGFDAALYRHAALSMQSKAICSPEVVVQRIRSIQTLR